MQVHFDYFEEMRQRLYTDAQVLIAYHWRKHLKKKRKKQEAARKRKAKLAEQKKKSPYGIAPPARPKPKPTVKPKEANPLSATMKVEKPGVGLKAPARRADTVVFPSGLASPGLSEGTPLAPKRRATNDKPPISAPRPAEGVASPRDALQRPTISKAESFSPA